MVRVGRGEEGACAGGRDGAWAASVVAVAGRNLEGTSRTAGMVQGGWMLVWFVFGGRRNCACGVGASGGTVGATRVVVGGPGAVMPVVGGVVVV